MVFMSGLWLVQALFMSMRAFSNSTFDAGLLEELRNASLYVHRHIFSSNVTHLLAVLTQAGSFYEETALGVMVRLDSLVRQFGCSHRVQRPRSSLRHPPPPVAGQNVVAGVANVTIRQCVPSPPTLVMVPGYTFRLHVVHLLLSRGV